MTTRTNPTFNPGPIWTAKETALRLKISASMLRKLTTCGAIGHVRLGAGAQRQRVGYTEAQIAAFIAARSVPATPGTPSAPVSMQARPVRSRAAKPTSETRSASASALLSGVVTEWAQR